ncbi:hypothetical protein AX17_006737 [Amanita inopinata Kibby_2008]|nr:hypothetical protein AX17_006737 [Amanita inopinata Kibby_2008]
MALSERYTSPADECTYDSLPDPYDTRRSSTGFIRSRLEYPLHGSVSPNGVRQHIAQVSERYAKRLSEPIVNVPSHCFYDDAYDGHTDWVYNHTHHAYQPMGYHPIKQSEYHFEAQPSFADLASINNTRAHDIKEHGLNVNFDTAHHSPDFASESQSAWNEPCYDGGESFYQPQAHPPCFMYPLTNPVAYDEPCSYPMPDYLDEAQAYSREDGSSQPNHTGHPHVPNTSHLFLNGHHVDNNNNSSSSSIPFRFMTDHDCSSVPPGQNGCTTVTSHHHHQHHMSHTERPPISSYSELSAQTSYYAVQSHSGLHLRHQHQQHLQQPQSHHPSRELKPTMSMLVQEPQSYHSTPVTQWQGVGVGAVASSPPPPPPHPHPHAHPPATAGPGPGRPILPFEGCLTMRPQRKDSKLNINSIPSINVKDGGDEELTLVPISPPVSVAMPISIPIPAALTPSSAPSSSSSVSSPSATAMATTAMVTVTVSGTSTTMAPIAPGPEPSRRSRTLSSPSRNQGMLKTIMMKRGGSEPKKQNLACLFCRERKIACGRPPEGSLDPTCNQCSRRSLVCQYPTESRRGQHKRNAKKGQQQQQQQGQGHGHEGGHDVNSAK